MRTQEQAKHPWLFVGTGTDPALNLAVEETILLEASLGPVLFLWQNAHTVVIGRGQNAWKECRTALLEQEGGTLARRTTGGGAVYHDLGNLNFSFVMPKDLYDVPRQLSVIRRAVAAFGIETENSGRNDIVITGTGEKFSGNAFRMTQQAALHHGTILCDVDMHRLGRYLAPPKEKLRAKGVESVRSRVGNLRAHAPQMDIPGLMAALQEAFILEYGHAQTGDWRQVLPEKQVESLATRNRSWAWTYGRTPQFDVTLEHKFPWGHVELHLDLRQGAVQRAQCHTDAMDPDLAQRVSEQLFNCLFTPEALKERLEDSQHPEDREIGAWLAQLDL